MRSSTRILVVIIGCLLLTACGSGKRNFAMKIHSDPLGAYLLMQVKYEGDENPDWIYLGPTPVILERPIKYEGATSVSLKVIRPGFYEQTKTWTAKEFKKEHKQFDQISWVPSMVRQ